MTPKGVLEHERHVRLAAVWLESCISEASGVANAKAEPPPLERQGRGYDYLDITTLDPLHLLPTSYFALTMNSNSPGFFALLGVLAITLVTGRADLTHRYS